MNILLERAKYEQRSGNTDNAIGYALQGLVDAENAQNYSYSVEFNFFLGRTFFDQKNYAKSIEHYINIIYPIEELIFEGQDKLAEAYYLLGNVYTAMGAAGEADRCYTTAYSQFEELNDVEGKIKSIRSNGLNLFNARDYVRSTIVYESIVDDLVNLTFNKDIRRQFYEEYLNAIRAKEDYTIGLKYGSFYYESRDMFSRSHVIADLLCSFHRENENLTESIEFGKEAVSQNDQEVEYRLNLVKSYLENKDYSNAQRQAMAAKSIADRTQDPKTIIKSYNVLGSVHLASKNRKDAIEILEKAEAIGDDNDLIFELEETYQLFVELYQKNLPAKERKYQFLLKDLLPRIEEANKQFESDISKANNLATSLEKKDRLQLANAQKQKRAVDQALLLKEQEQQKVKLLQQESIIRDQVLERQRLEALGIQQNLRITQQELDAQRRDAELQQLQNQAELAASRERESQQQLEIARNQQTILEQQSELQKTEIASARARQTFLIIIVVVSLLAVVALVFFLIRLNRSRKTISNQNKDLELQQYELQQAQIELTKMLDKEQKTRKNLQQSNRDLKSAQSQLIHAEKMSSLGQLTAGIVHEINNPVNFVKGGIETLNRTITEIMEMLNKVYTPDGKTTLSEQELQVLKESIVEELGFANEVVPQILKDMVFGTNRIEDIVNGLRIFSRTGEVKSKVVDLHETVEAALLILRPKAKKIGEIQKDYDESIGQIECFPGQLNQVLVNLVSNGLDAVEKNGLIKVTTKDLGDNIAIYVEDNGSGMEKEVMEHIFEPFYTTKEVGKGTGLGLSISYSIIEKHGGHLEVQSEVGKGTKFTITLRKSMSDVIEEDEEETISSSN